MGSSEELVVHLPKSPAGVTRLAELRPLPAAGRRGDGLTDVQRLASRIAGRAEHYRDLRRQQAASEVLARWPLLREIAKGPMADADGAAVE